MSLGVIARKQRVPRDWRLETESLEGLVLVCLEWLANLAQEQGERRRAGQLLDAAALLRADLVDEAVLIRAPRDIGAQGIEALEVLSLDALTRSPKLALVSAETVGDDSIEIFEGC